MTLTETGTFSRQLALRCSTDFPSRRSRRYTTNFCYGIAPDSAHVMWATPMWSGGIMDARFGNIGYETGHYEGRLESTNQSSTGKSSTT